MRLALALIGCTRSNYGGYNRIGANVITFAYVDETSSCGAGHVKKIVLGVTYWQMGLLTKLMKMNH